MHKILALICMIGMISIIRIPAWNLNSVLGRANY